MEFSIDSLEVCDELDSLSVHSEHQDDQTSSETLSPWEKWMIEKTRKYREQRKLALKIKIEEECLKREKRKQTRERKCKAEACHRQWVIVKNHQVKKEKEEQKRKLEEERALAEEKQVVMKQKTEENFKKWCKLKDQEKMHKKEMEAKEEALKIKKQLERQQQAEEAYHHWLHQQKERTCWWKEDLDSVSITHSWVGPLDQDWGNENHSVSNLNITITKT